MKCRSIATQQLLVCTRHRRQCAFCGVIADMKAHAKVCAAHARNVCACGGFADCEAFVCDRCAVLHRGECAGAACRSSNEDYNAGREPGRRYERTRSQDELNEAE